MKKILLISLVLSFNSFGFLINGGTDSMSASFCEEQGHAPVMGGPLVCGITTTTSLPTVLVEDSEVAVNSQDLESLLYAEMESDYTPVMDAVARDLGVTPAMVKGAIAELVANGEAITIANIKLLI